MIPYPSCPLTSIKPLGKTNAVGDRENALLPANRLRHGDGSPAPSPFHGFGVAAGFAGLLCLTASSRTCAFELFDSVQVHGFASQVMFLTSHNNMFGKSEKKPSFDFTELGINGSWSPLPKLRLSMQLLSRRAGAGNNGSPVVDFGLVDYSVIDEDDLRIGFRGGRVRLPYGLYNDTRDVAFTRPSVLLPQSIYFERTRDITLSGDGVLFYGEYRHPWGNLTLELAGGYPRTDDTDTKISALGQNAAGSLEGEPSLTGRLGYELDGGRLRLAISGADTTINYRPKSGPVPDPLRAGSAEFSPVIFSAQYNTEKWTLTSEYAIRPFRRIGFGPRLDVDVVGESYYFQAAYRFAPQWEIMARYDSLVNNRDDPNGQRIQAITHGAVPAYTQFAKNWTVGIRYDITSSLMARVEYNNVNGTAWVPPQDNPSLSAQSQHWDMFAFLLSLRF